MNGSNPVQQRGHRGGATMLQRLLEMQGLLPAEHSDEQEDVGVATDEAQDRPEEPRASSHSRNVGTGAVDELLEHLDVVAFFGQLVQ